MNTEQTKAKKRIAFVHDVFPGVGGGGAERITFDLANYLSRQGYEVFVWAYKHNTGSYPARLPVNFRVICLPDPDVYRSQRNACFMADLVRQLHLDVLVSVVNPLIRIREILPEGSSCRYVMANHGKPFWEMTGKIDRRRHHRYRTLLGKWIWWIYDCPRIYGFKVYERRFLRRYRQAYEQADAYVVLCEGYRRELCDRLHLNPANARIWAIPNSERQAEGDMAGRTKRKQVLYVGRMSYDDKRVDRLIRIWSRVWRRMPDWELILLGDGRERSDLEALAARLQAGHLRFEGTTTHVETYYREAAILCLTSTREGWGLCLTEAQAHGVVPVAFDCSSGVHEILAPSGVNGILVSPFDEDAYAAELLGLMRDEERRRVMQRNVVEKSRTYTIESVGEAWLNMLDTIANRAGASAPQ